LHAIEVIAMGIARRRTCPHIPECPPPEGLGREAAAVIVAHHEQGWSLLCNGVIIFDDLGELLPDGRQIGPLCTQVHLRSLEPALRESSQ
jgi:hypothetical protein